MAPPAVLTSVFREASKGVLTKGVCVLAQAGRSSDGRRTVVRRADGRSAPTDVPFFPKGGSAPPQLALGGSGEACPPSFRGMVWEGLPPQLFGGKAPPSKNLFERSEQFFFTVLGEVDGVCFLGNECDLSGGSGAGA